MKATKGGRSDKRLRYRWHNADTKESRYGLRGSHSLTNQGMSLISIGHAVRARPVWPRPEGTSPRDQGLAILAIGGW